MALTQSAWALGSKQLARPQTAYADHSQLFVFDVPAAGFALGDILELAGLPPYARIVDAALVAVGDFTDETVDVGIMSGTFGETTNDDDTDRTVGAELFSAATPAGVIRTSLAAGLLLDPEEYTRSIGILCNTAVAYAEGKQIGLQLTFAQ